MEVLSGPLSRDYSAFYAWRFGVWSVESLDPQRGRTGSGKKGWAQLGVPAGDAEEEQEEEDYESGEAEMTREENKCRDSSREKEGGQRGEREEGRGEQLIQCTLIPNTGNS